MPRTFSRRALLLGLLAATASVRAGAQTPERPLPQSGGLIIANVSSYESIYGRPVYYSIEVLVTLNRTTDSMAPSGRSVRTRGVFVAQGEPRLCNPEATKCLRLVPVPEMQNDFAFQASSRAGDTVEVTGALLGSDILFWSFLSAEEMDRKADPRNLPLERLVRNPEQFRDRTVVARGAFRGRNLFAEMPQGSARTASDWVLGDGPFFIWVTGKQPRGRGFALDPASVADAAQRLEVEGRIEVSDGLVYLRARRVRLIGREDAQSADGDPP